MYKVYTSTLTPNRNIATSIISQEDADQKAQAMDIENNYDCTNCTNCNYCTNCTNCNYCTYCVYCNYCNYCANCTDCTDCATQPIQIIGGDYSVTIRKNGTMKIGCKDFLISHWKDESSTGISSSLTPKELELWNKYKQIILNLAEAL